MTRLKLLLISFFWLILAFVANAQEAPVTQAGIVFPPGSYGDVPITVVNFNNIGAISLTMHYDASIALASTIVPNPILSDGIFSYTTATPGNIVISWYGDAGVSITDGSELFSIHFLKVSVGTTSLDWIDNGISSEYSTYENGYYPVLNDSPTNSFYISGQLTFGEDAPRTSLPTIYACPNSLLQVPVYVKDFNHIGAISLTMDYNPSILVFQGFVPHISLPDNFTVQAAVPGRMVASGWVVDGNPGLSLADSTVLFYINFLYNGGVTGISWYDNSISCEYTNDVPQDFTPLYDLPTQEYYFNGFIYEQNRPTGTVSGSETINAGQYTDITFNLSGTPPWTLTYTDGTTPVTISNILTSPKVISVNPQVTTTYTISTLNDALCEAQPVDISGSAIITVNDFLFNITLQKSTNCGEFSVLLNPEKAINNDLTKIVFTVKWLAFSGSDVQVDNIVSLWPNIIQVGSRVLYEGYYYVTFSSTTAYSVNWSAGSSNQIMSFMINGIGEGTTDFTIIGTDFNNIAPGLNTAYHIEMASVNETGIIINNANSAYLNCGLYLKDFLQGPYNAVTHNMNINLKSLGYLPLHQPYASTPIAYLGNESVASFTASVVDWVVIELRTGTAANTKITRQAALLLNNGNIVGTDQVNAPVFHNIIPGNSYYVVIYHRNHLPVMTSTAIVFPNTLLNKHDFTTSPAENVYSSTNGVYPVESGVYSQIVGDVNMDFVLKYSGSNNDAGLIIFRIGTIVNPLFLNSIINGYYAEDLTMDGQVKYSGSNNDKSIIIANIDFLTNPTFLNTTYTSAVPFTVIVNKDLSVNHNDESLDIAVKEEEKTYEIILKSNNYLEFGAFDNIQFTVKWKVGANNNKFDYSGDYKLTAQGEPVKNGEWYFQTFAMVDWIEFSEDFKNGKEITIMQINKDKNQQFEGITIAEDEFCVATNRDYYISIFGRNSTGKVLSIEQLEKESSLSVYPNPVSGNTINLSLNDVEGEIAEIVIFDLLSRQVQRSLVNIGSGKNKSAIIDISDLLKGYYFLQINISGKMFSEKIIKQ